MRRSFRVWIVVGMIVVVALVVLGVTSSSHVPMTERASENWSRGRGLGKMSVKRAVGLCPAPDGGVFIAWPNLDGDLVLARIGPDGEILSQEALLSLGARTGRDPQLQVVTGGTLHMLWREQGGPRPVLKYTVLDVGGSTVQNTVDVSDPDKSVSEAPRLLQATGGSLHALWVDEDGVYWVPLNPAGELAQEPVLLVPGGEELSAQVDAMDHLHLAWQSRIDGNTVGIYYATVDPVLGQTAEIAELARVVVGVNSQLRATALALDEDTTYLFWSVYERRYDQYTFQVTSFPLGSPEMKQTVDRRLRKGDGPNAIAPLDGQPSSLLLALTERTLGSDQQLTSQVALITAGGGGEEMVTDSPQASLKPRLVRDDRSHLHLAWLDTSGFGEYRVFYASTAPQVQENYNALTLFDALNVALTGVFRLSTGIVSLVAALAVWAVAPLLLVGLYHVVTHEESLTTLRGRVALVIVLAVEVLLTFLWVPRLGTAVAGSTVRWIVPAVSAAVSTGVTVFTVRRRSDPHIFGAFFLFTILNSALQMAMYLLLVPAQ